MNLRPMATLLAVLAILPVGISASDATSPELEAALQSKYVNNVYVLRGFYDGSHLHFDRNGSPLGEVYRGPWTTASIAIEQAKVSPKNIQLLGFRIAELYDSKQSKFVPARSRERVFIDIDRDAAAPDSVSMAAIEHIFLGLNEPVSNVVPVYWKAFISGAVEIVHGKGKSNCYRIKGRLIRTVDGDIAIGCNDGASVKSSTSPNTIDETSVHKTSLPYEVGKLIKPPRPVYQPDPGYWPLAKELNVEGTTILQLVVQTDGSPSDIQIVAPIGVGLDDEAVAAVKAWRFQPATLNGQPVPVRISLQMDFHLAR